MSRLITRQEIAEAAEGAYTMARVDNGGHNAHYIPYLANVPSDLFALTVTLPDGEVFSFGDDAYVFGIESVSKVASAILAMKQWSPEMVLRKIGADATGLPFSSIFSILLENDHPSAPWSTPEPSRPARWSSPWATRLGNGKPSSTTWCRSSAQSRS